MSAGELGSSSKSVETGLGDAIKLAETWHAIILIDEADIFMEQRNLNDLERNSLVSGIILHCFYIDLSIS